jgi:hypothetical protein
LSRAGVALLEEDLKKKAEDLEPLNTFFSVPLCTYLVSRSMRKLTWFRPYRSQYVE